MSYFDDIQFIHGDVVPNCQSLVDRQFVGTYSLEFMSAGWMYYGVDHGRQTMINEPIAFWHHPRHSYQYGALNDRGWDHHYILMKGPRARRLIEQGLMPLAQSFHMTVPEPRLFKELFEELVALVRGRDQRRHPDAVALLERMAALLVNWSQPSLEDSGPSKSIRVIIERIGRDPSIDYDFEEEATAVGLSYSHFRRLFRSLVGRPPHEYLLSCRMHLAGSMLQDQNLQVKEIAYRLGYDDPAQFSKLFKNKVGLSPLQYRESLPKPQRGEAG